MGIAKPSTQTCNFRPILRVAIYKDAKSVMQ